MFGIIKFLLDIDLLDDECIVDGYFKIWIIFN